MVDDIDPGRSYPFALARQFIPGGCEEGGISLSTLHRWRRAGLFSAEFRCGPRGGKRWFIRGQDLARLIEMESVPANSPVPRSKTESDCDYRQAMTAAEKRILGSYDILGGIRPTSPR
jgi:hypothetical protein